MSLRFCVEYYTSEERRNKKKQKLNTLFCFFSTTLRGKSNIYIIRSATKYPTFSSYTTSHDVVWRLHQRHKPLDCSRTVSSAIFTASFPYQPSRQALHPPQLTHVGTVALETPRRGRPPGGQARRNSTRAGAVERNVGDREIIPPYPWATKKPAVIHTIRDLSFKNINVISGKVHCKPCHRTQTLEYNLMDNFSELYGYIKDNKEVLRQRAPPMWLTPELIRCGTYQSEMKPVISERKEEINWLILLLGKMLGCCTLEQLRFFCEVNSRHRTGAKDRVLCIIYLGLCKQLDPEGPFSL